MVLFLDTQALDNFQVKTLLPIALKSCLIKMVNKTQNFIKIY